MYFITTKRMLVVCFSAHPNIQYRTVFIKNKDRVILFCGTMDFLSNTMKQMFSSASKSCILYLMLSYSV